MCIYGNTTFSDFSTIIYKYFVLIRVGKAFVLGKCSYAQMVIMIFVRGWQERSGR